MDLCEIFQDNFEGFTEKDLRSASIYQHYKLRDHLCKYSVWVQYKNNIPLPNPNMMHYSRKSPHHGLRER